MAFKASKIRSLMVRNNCVQGMMVAAMSGKQIEIRTNGKASLNPNKETIPSLGRQIRVIKKADRRENVTRSRVTQNVSEADVVRMELRDLVPVSNRQIGGIRRSDPKSIFDGGGGFERLSSKERMMIDHKRQRRSPKGSLKLTREFAY